MVFSFWDTFKEEISLYLFVKEGTNLAEKSLVMKQVDYLTVNITTSDKDSINRQWYSH